MTQMPKPKQYASNAERQRAYRERERTRITARKDDLRADPKKRFRYDLHRFVTHWLALSKLTFDDVADDIDQYQLEVRMKDYRQSIGSPDADEWFYEFMENGAVSYDNAPHPPQQTQEARDDN
jgi:hypothetical protein